MSEVNMLRTTDTPGEVMPTFAVKATPGGTRPFSRRLLYGLRRTHMYLGLFLFPWALLYGITGFLFNHPTFFADALTVPYDRADLIGTALEAPPGPQQHAEAVVAALRERLPASPHLVLAEGSAHYGTREFFVITARAGERSFFVTYDPQTAGGIIRETTQPGQTENAPFRVGIAEPPRQRGMGMMGPMKPNPHGIHLPDSIVSRLKAGIPQLLTKKGLPLPDEVMITTAPDIKFSLDFGGELWTAIYNPLTGAVSGVRGRASSELSLRSFLLRMHLSRGYPAEWMSKPIKFSWALGVDALSLALCFWGLSGLCMWWQIKAARRFGLLVLALSGFSAVILAVNMHRLLSM